ncbi:MAG: FAD-dependent oxidoreductase [Pseudomonadota bacterium]
MTTRKREQELSRRAGQGRSGAAAIIGAGPAGIAAAVAAARAGAQVYLIESSSRLGGSATNARVGTVCGLSRCGVQLTSVPSFDAPGFAREFSMRLAELSGTQLVRNGAGLTYLPYAPEAFEVAADEMLSSLDDRVKLIIQKRLTATELAPDGGSFLLEVAGEQIIAQALVDCSGDAVVSRQLGLSVHVPTPYQSGALVFELCGLPPLNEVETSFLIRKTLREGVIDGALPERCSYVSIVPGSLRGASAAFKLGTRAPKPETGGADSAGAVEREAREDLQKLVPYLVSSAEPLQDLTLGGVAASLGVRSGFRGEGKSVLSEQDLMSSEPCVDGVALGFWPAERWDTPVRPELTYLGEGLHYEIPLGALCSRELPGVYFAGRCISATDQAIASARVIGTCLLTGYAAGRAAVGYLRGDPTERTVADLRAEQVEPFYRQLNGDSARSL